MLSAQGSSRGRVYLAMNENGRHCADRKPPPGDFTSDELREDTTRFLDELRRRAEKKQQRKPRKRPGPPPKDD
jgi:hypothetical protein